MSVASQTLLDNVEAAINALLTGKIAEYELNGRKVRYQDLGELRKLREDLRTEVASTSGNRTIKSEFPS